jgi:gas vesicle protein
MRIINFVAGFLSGVLLGAVAILLTTPQSGTDLQADVKNWFNNVIEEGRRAAADRRAELEDRFTDLTATT